MNQVLEVIYHDGVLTPLQPLDLPDNQRLEITLHVPTPTLPPTSGRTLANELLRIGRECASLPVVDAHPADAILGYDRYGVPQS